MLPTLTGWLLFVRVVVFLPSPYPDQPPQPQMVATQLGPFKDQAACWVATRRIGFDPSDSHVRCLAQSLGDSR